MTHQDGTDSAWECCGAWECVCGLGAQGFPTFTGGHLAIDIHDRTEYIPVGSGLITLGCGCRVPASKYPPEVRQSPRRFCHHTKAHCADATYGKVARDGE